MSDTKLPAPGSISIRPTRTEAENDKGSFYELLAAVRGFGDLPYKKIADIIGDKTANYEANISKRIKSKTIPDEARRLILDHIFEDENLLSGETRKQVDAIDDALYFAFLNYFDAKETSQDNARARIEGTYKLWRFSVEHDGEFILGKITFKEDPKTRAVGVEMVQVRRPKQNMHAMTERFSGYMFRISHMHLMLMRDELVKDCRVTIFPRAKLDFVGTEENPRSVFAGRRLHVIQMDGFGLGIDGSSGFFSPVHLSLVDDVDELAKLDAMLDVVPEGDERIPERVATKLKRSGPLRRL